MISGRDVQRRGMADCIAEALTDRRGRDRPHLPERRYRLPGLPLGDRHIGHLAGRAERLAADGGGIRLRAGSRRCGAIDLVEIDPSRDVKDLTSRTGCSVLLTFFAGLYRRLYGDDGYRA